ncbi:hypothetical protein RhiXN_07682 [Rhizoctonia solani]|uniref:Uncharacterized protein n=1 Tax=Rhizoctonia solani TaxID=456999 RepID=A0A8H8SXZ2_9AGAM|nr:uncharacterized protein RhiXN_07682 [Rhizoctonia solani]QRW22646.1 hypothetical protein RhiXN_07682 [Rhizoctonia solani]
MGRNHKIRTLRSPTCVNLHSGLDPANITLPANFTFHAVSKQDIWHPPEVPAGEEYDSPTYYVQYGPIHKFKSAQVSICGMSGTKQYDQAGLIFLVNSPGLEGEKYDSWIKTGVEIIDTNATSKVMAVATPPGGFSDWNLVPMPKGEFEGNTKTLMRLITWPFQKNFNKWLGVGTYVARHNWAPGEPPFTGEPNSAKFEGLKIDWSDWNGTTSQYTV